MIFSVTPWDILARKTRVGKKGGVKICIASLLRQSVDTKHTQRKRGGEPTNRTNYDHIRTCFVHGVEMMPGQRAESGVGKYCIMPRAAAKGSTQLY